VEVMNKLILTLLLIIAGFPLVVRAQCTGQTAKDAKSGSVEEELMKLEREGVDAMLRKDVSFSEKLQAPDFLFIDPAGMIHTKEQDLAIARSGDLKFESFSLDEMKVRVYGDAAVVTGLSTVKGAFKTMDISGKYRWTDVFVKRDGKWQLVNAQLTPVQGP
jgi:ketosteroid isomerase-like protein